MKYEDKLRPYIEKISEMVKKNPDRKVANIVVYNGDDSKLKNIDDIIEIKNLIQNPINFKTIDFDGGSLIISYDMYYPQIGIAFKYEPEEYEILYDSHYDIQSVITTLLESSIDIKSKLRIIRLLCHRVQES